MSEKDGFATQAFTNDTTQTCATQLQGDNRRVDCIHDDFFLEWTPLARMQENSLFHDLYCYIYKLKLTYGLTNSFGFKAYIFGQFLPNLLHSYNERYSYYLSSYRMRNTFSLNYVHATSSFHSFIS
uniref:(northern house mosquito) hypothetical protein n=1 Tax=Culex pipiens TaxID=7175 RepID=A0A8D8B131_CULPI